MLITPRNVALLGRSAAWTPASLGSALLGWWDAERLDKLTLAGSAVTTWSDIVGSYAPTQAISGSKPAYSATGLNGRPAVVFDGTDDELTLGSVPFPAAVEVWLLADQTALAADTTVRVSFCFGGTANGTNFRISRTVVSAVNRARATTGVLGATDSSVDLSGVHIPQMIASTTAIAVAVDGGASTSQAAATVLGSTRVRIGASIPNTASLFHSGAINSILVLDSSSSLWTAANQALLLAFLKRRGGIA